jgi:hypothetical protein
MQLESTADVERGCPDDLRVSWNQMQLGLHSMDKFLERERPIDNEEAATIAHNRTASGESTRRRHF